ncbi:hypothetical protein Pelo_3717 [Pelomyxa schiedti]|nr:hypothetical protein Pelo_3717 [Pelomyxa schiedti]
MSTTTDTDEPSTFFNIDDILCGETFVPVRFNVDCTSLGFRPRTRCLPLWLAQELALRGHLAVVKQALVDPDLVQATGTSDGTSAAPTSTVSSVVSLGDVDGCSQKYTYSVHLTVSKLNGETANQEALVAMLAHRHPTVYDQARRIAQIHHNPLGEQATAVEGAARGNSLVFTAGANPYCSSTTNTSTSTSKGVVVHRGGTDRASALATLPAPHETTLFEAAYNSCDEYELWRSRKLSTLTKSKLLSTTCIVSVATSSDLGKKRPHS